VTMWKRKHVRRVMLSNILIICRSRWDQNRQERGLEQCL
jgi:hypothetical protein